jgi:hypothetical protein
MSDRTIAENIAVSKGRRDRMRGRLTAVTLAANSATHGIRLCRYVRILLESGRFPVSAPRTSISGKPLSTIIPAARIGLLVSLLSSDASAGKKFMASLVQSIFAPVKFALHR